MVEVVPDAPCDEEAEVALGLVGEPLVVPVAADPFDWAVVAGLPHGAVDGPDAGAVPVEPAAPALVAAELFEAAGGVLDEVAEVASAVDAGAFAGGVPVPDVALDAVDDVPEGADGQVDVVADGLEVGAGVDVAGAAGVGAGVEAGDAATEGLDAVAAAGAALADELTAGMDVAAADAAADVEGALDEFGIGVGAGVGAAVAVGVEVDAAAELAVGVGAGVGVELDAGGVEATYAMS